MTPERVREVLLSAAGRILAIGPLFGPSREERAVVEACRSALISDPKLADIIAPYVKLPSYGVTGGFVFTGDHKGAVTAKLSGDGRKKLKAWRDAAGYGGHVWLCDGEGCSALLTLPDATIDQDANWQGEVFSLTGSALTIAVDATDAASAYAALDLGLFSRFDGQSGTGKASFPVYAGAISFADTPLDLLSTGRCRVKQVPCPDTLQGRYAAIFGDTVDLEYLTVTVTMEQGSAEFWKPAA